MQPLTLSLPSLETWVARVFRGAGLDEDSAVLAAKRLLLADITGVRTHGIARLPSYWHQLGKGGLNAKPAIADTWRGSVLVIDADLGLGQVVGPRAFALALDALGPARSFVPFIIRNAGHLGALGSHLFEVAERGKIAFLSQVTQPVMSPVGATQPAIGNNPIAFGAPRPDGPPFVIDFAMSNVARARSTSRYGTGYRSRTAGRSTKPAFRQQIRLPPSRARSSRWLVTKGSRSR
jgi:LDH2 family malate/lactate/ureidoglycolate dehydrogenase